MIINANAKTNRTKLLVENYLKLINSGVNPEDILVLVQNSKKKKDFIEQVKKQSKKGSIGSLKIYSFWGLAYNFVQENWAIVENSIKDEKNSKISPNLCGLEISQNLFKECIKEVDFTGYNSKTSLLHQLLRRYSLITLNDLSDKEVDFRSSVLSESFGAQAKEAISKYKIKTIEKRAFDYIRQIDIFEFLYKKIENPFKYVFLDDGDEITPSILSYLEYIKPSVKEFFIGYDEFGSSRLGYLGAININFEKLLNQKEQKLEISDNSKKIFESIKNDEKIELENIKTKTFLRRDEMINNVLEDIKNLIKKGVRPNEISVITPISDEFLKSAFQKSNFKFNFLSKSEKLNQNKIIGYILEFLKIINDKDNSDISPYILKGILIELLKYDDVEALKLIQEYKNKRQERNANIFEFLKLELYEKIRFEKLSSQLYEIVINYVPLIKENVENIIKINQLLKQVYDLEEVFRGEVSNLELIIQLENTIISENPLSDVEIEDDSIVVSSAQKIIDYSYKTKYQFLLDVNNDNWIKQDIGPLYNAWVMQKKWQKEKWELEDNISLTKDKMSRMLYKLYLLGDDITLYSSVYDSLGLENISGIDKYFKYQNEVSDLKIKPIVPRKDQEEVLKYKGGLMSVSATAGSGKTTIMLLLVDKILSGKVLDNIESKNIFVLTFMESAARNFRERIKAKYPNLAELPNISTIHGLALRIIKENNNYARLNLDFDFEIIDDIKRIAFLNEIMASLSIPSGKTDIYNRAISAYKNELALNDGFKTANTLFLNVYNLYQKKLKEQNLLDYDDLLLYSLKLLKENKDILEYYQDMAKIIIEDEAQDSSFVQQSLIKLLSSKHGNVIRCGDINQAITTTFTNSDVQGFRDFMKKSKNVVMDRCQRCATGVLDYANKTVKYAKDNKVDAFSSLIMKPVEDVNIVDKNAVIHNILETEKEENAFILKTVKNILKNDKNATIAVLLRSNFQIDKWDGFLKNNSIKTYRNSDNLINNKLFHTVILILQFIKEPYDVENIKKIAQLLYDIGYYKLDTLKYAMSLKEPIFLRKDYDEPLFWDMNYFLFKNHCSIYDLVDEIGNFYFSNTKETANIPLICAIAQKIQNSSKSFEQTVEKLVSLQNKNNFSNIKFFDIEDNSLKNSKVQIMTLHKSKGDEFDYVFIPELTQDNLCFNVKDYKLKENSKFIQKVKANPKTDEALKQEIIEENYRLIYVGITRARKKLYLTSAKKYKSFYKMREVKPSDLLEEIC